LRLPFFYPHIVKLIVQATNPRWINLLLLSPTGTKSLDFDRLLLPAVKPVWFFLFEKFSGMKKAALDNFVPNMIFYFFSLKFIKRAGRWGRPYEKISRKQYYEKLSYTATQKYQKYQRLFCMARPSPDEKRLP